MINVDMELATYTVQKLLELRDLTFPRLIPRPDDYTLFNCSNQQECSAEMDIIQITLLTREIVSVSAGLDLYTLTLHQNASRREDKLS